MTKTILHYRKMRLKGACVKCGAPAAGKADGGFSSLCPVHLEEHRSSKPWQITAVDEAIPCKPEPPRAAYQAEYLKGLPPLPRQCPRCTAQLFPCLMAIDLNYLPAVQCVNCGFGVDQVAWRNKLVGAA